VLVGPVGTSILPAFVGRDGLRTGNIDQVDMRYTRKLFAVREHVQAKFIAEANNVFNTRNVTSLNTSAIVNPLGIVTTPPSLAPTATVLEGRLIQLGIRADW
jgi:hypothetical protein